MKLPAFFFALMTVAVLGSGCSTVQERLAGGECECEPVEPCEISPEMIASAVVTQQVHSAHRVAATRGQELTRKAQEAAAEADKDDDGIRRAEDLASERIDPTLSDAAVDFDDDDERDAFAERYDIALPDNAEVFRHQFAPDDRSALAVHTPGVDLRIYADDNFLASIDLEDYDEVIADDDALPVSSDAIDLVRGDITQLQLIHASTDDDGATTYYMAVYKLIGPKIGTIFHKPFAIADDDGAISPLAEVRYLYGLESRVIEWVSLTDGEPVEEPDHYEWNRWEGVYRIPEPPPTAPDPGGSS